MTNHAKKLTDTQNQLALLYGSYNQFCQNVATGLFETESRMVTGYSPLLKLLPLDLRKLLIKFGSLLLYYISYPYLFGYLIFCCQNVATLTKLIPISAQYIHLLILFSRETALMRFWISGQQKRQRFAPQYSAIYSSAFSCETGSNGIR